MRTPGSPVLMPSYVTNVGRCHRIPGGLALLGGALLPLRRRDRPVRLPPVLLLAKGLALVVLLLASCEGDLGLGPAVPEVQGEGHDRVTRLLGLGLQLVDLLAVQQQLALAARGVIGPTALVILRDVSVVQPRLAPVDLDEAVGQRGAALAQRLDLGAHEDQPGLEGVDDRVVVPGLLVLGDDLALAALLPVLGLAAPATLLRLGLLRYVHSLAHSAAHFRTSEGGEDQPLS